MAFAVKYIRIWFLHWQNQVSLATGEHTYVCKGLVVILTRVLRSLVESKVLSGLL